MQTLQNQFLATLRQSTRLQSLLTACLAFAGYGSWAAWSNNEFGYQISLKAFVAQGGFAFIATVSLTLIAASLYKTLGQSALAIACAFGCCFAISVIVPAFIHWLIGTPKILQSMLPGLILGSAYLSSYLLFLHRSSRVQ